MKSREFFRSNGAGTLAAEADASPCCVQIFDRLVPCLKDVNSKVTLLALGVLCDVLPCVGPHMANVASLTVSNVAANLASSNAEIHDAASHALNQLIQLVGTLDLASCLCTAMMASLPIG